jgi:hypothetical protein
VIEDLYKKIDSLKFNIDADHGTLLKHDDILHKVDNALDKMLAGVQASQQMPSTANPQGGFSLGGISIQDILAMAKEVGFGGGGVDPMTATYTEIGKRIFSGTIDSTVKKLTGSFGKETAGHVVIDTGHS